MYDVLHFIEAKSKLGRLEDMSSILRVMMLRWTLNTGEKGILTKKTNLVKNKK